MTKETGSDIESYEDGFKKIHSLMASWYVRDDSGQDGFKIIRDMELVIVDLIYLVLNSEELTMSEKFCRLDHLFFMKKYVPTRLMSGTL